jgi:hypothetical protein
VLRLLIADLVGEEATGESVATLRAELDDLFARIDDMDDRAKQLPHRSKYLLIVNGFLRRLLELHREWIDEVERELSEERQSSRR